jgi:hypothetical protein
MKIPKKRKLSKLEIEDAILDIDNFQVPLDPVDFNEELVKGYDRIIVVGPQRSGTTFVGQAISDTLRKWAVGKGEEFVTFHKPIQEFAPPWVYVDEDRIYKPKNVDWFKEQFSEKFRVIQDPRMTYLIHDIAEENDLIVFMVRRWSDILKSLYRIKENGISNWIKMNVVYDMNKKNYDYVGDELYEKYVDRNSYYLDVTYKMWKYYQRDRIPNYIELNYESMSVHPLWVSKEKRIDFEPKRIR